nr:zinc finger, CCHC-type [Tanacetum cinerariifolium]
KGNNGFPISSVDQRCDLQVAGCKTTKELWESLKKRHVGEEKVQQARLQSLMIGFQTLQMKENGYATKAKELGKTLDESLLVRKLLDSTHDRFKIFSGKLESRWSGPFTISEIYPYGTAKLIHPDGCNFKVNCHRLKHYHGGDPPPLEISNVTTFPKDN